MKKYNLNMSYNVKIDFDIFSNFLEIITYFYLPLIENDGFVLYFFLMSEAKNNLINNSYISSSRISKIVSMNEERLNYVINNLEILGLLEVYYESNDYSKITYLLKKPLTFNEINENEIFNDLLEDKLNKENSLINLNFFRQNIFDKNNKELVINKKIISLDNNLDKTIELNNFSFEFNTIFSLFENKNINYKSFWNLEFEKLIKNLFVYYDLGSLDVLDIVLNLLEKARKINLVNFLEEFFKGKYKKNDLNKKNSVNDKLYFLKTLSPFEFLQKRLKRSINLNEKEFILKLLNDYGFKFDVINLLLDFSIIINKGRINLNYIEKIAKTLIDNENFDFETIKNYLKNAYLMKNNKKNLSNNIKLDKKNDIEINKQILEFVKEW